MLTEERLDELGFENGEYETEYYYITLFFYDGWNLVITSKPNCGKDEVYIMGFDENHLFHVIYAVTEVDFIGFEKNKNG